MAWQFGQQPIWEGHQSMNYMYHPLATPGVDWRPTAEIDEPTPVLSPNDYPPFPTHITPTSSDDRLTFSEPFPPDGAARQNSLRDQPAAITSPPSARGSSANEFAQLTPNEPRLAVGETSRQGRNLQTQSRDNNHTARFVPGSREAREHD